VAADATHRAAAIIADRNPREEKGLKCENMSQSRRLIIEAAIRL